MRSVLKILLLVFAPLVSYAQEPSSVGSSQVIEPMAAPNQISLQALVTKGHFDQVATDFSGLVEEAIHQASTYGYYFTVEQRRQLYTRINTEFSAQNLSNAFIRVMQQHQNRSPVKTSLHWFGTSQGREVLAELDRAFQPSASSRQANQAQALRADADLITWWQTFNSKYSHTEHYLTLRQQLLEDTVQHLAKTMKPHTPFNIDLLRQRLDLNTFELRPEIERSWRLRYLDVFKKLEVSARLRFLDFSLSPDYIGFVSAVSEANKTVYTQQTQQLFILLTEFLTPPVPEKTQEPQL